VASPPVGTAQLNTTHDAAGNAVPDCDASKHAIDATLSASSTCQSDEDCRLISLPCPFGCLRAVRHSMDVERLMSDIREFKDACNACVYRCRKLDGDAACRDGLCRLSPQ